MHQSHRNRTGTVDPRGREEEEIKNYCFMDREFSFCEMENFWALLHNSVNALSQPNEVLKFVTVLHPMLYVFSHN